MTSQISAHGAVGKLQSESSSQWHPTRELSHPELGWVVGGRDGNGVGEIGAGDQTVHPLSAKIDTSERVWFFVDTHGILHL